MELGSKTMTLLREFCLLTNFQSKSYTNLREFVFWRKKRNEHRDGNFWTKCNFGGQNVGIWPKNDESPMESCSLTHFQTKGCTNLCESKFWGKKQNEHQNENFLKIAI